MKTNTTIADCSNCNARINVHVQECPWCGTQRDPPTAPPIRKRLSLGALITILTLAALLTWLMSFQAPEPK